ncbi:MAG: tape measure protein [Pseudomonadota bacterium]
MTATVGSINVLFDVEYGRAIRGIEKMAKTTEQGGERAARSITRIDRSAVSMNRTLSGIRGREFRVLSLSALRAERSVDRLRGVLLATSTLFGGFGAAFTIKGIADYSDTYKEVGNRLRIVKNEAQSLRDIELDIFDIAQRSRAQYQSTGVLFARIAASAKRLNIAQSDTLRVTETIQKAFLVGGSTPLEASQSAIQLSQGIASNRLQGDELRSVLENPALGQLLADRISGGDIGKIRELAKEGQLTARTIIHAFKSASGEIDRLFAQTEQTIGQAFVRIDNALIRYIGTSDKVNSSSQATVVFLNAIADNIDEIADSLLILGGAFLTVFGARQLGNIQAHVRQMILTRQETRAAAIAAVELAKAEQAASRSKFLATRLELNRVMNDGVSTSKQVERAQRKVEAASRAQKKATTQLTAAQGQLNKVFRSQTVAMGAASVAARGFGAALNFLGGPVGVALLALGGAMFVMSKRAAEAEERAESYADAIERAGKKSGEAAKDIREVAKALAEQKEFTTEAARNIAIREQLRNASSYADELRALTNIAPLYRVESRIPFAEAMKEQIELLIDGKIKADEFTKTLDGLTNGDHLLEGLVPRLERIAILFLAAKGRAEGFQKTIENIGRAGAGFDSHRFKLETDEQREKRLAKTRSNSEQALNTFVGRVVKAESGGNRFAKNPNSTATGLGQFIESTWLRLFRQEFPDRARGLQRSAILALRTDSDVSKRLIEAYAKENSETLQRAGVAVTDASLHLSHFLGAGDAIKVLKANSSTPLDGLISSSSINANKSILSGRTAGDAIAYAQRRAGDTRVAAGDLSREERERLRVRQAIDQVSQSITKAAEKRALEHKLLKAGTFERVKALSVFEQEQQYKARSVPLTEKLNAEIEKTATQAAKLAVEQEKAANAAKFLGFETDRQIALMSDLDRETIEAARSFGAAETQINRYIAAVRSGNLQSAPEMFRQIRVEMEKTAENQKVIDLIDGASDSFGDFFRDVIFGAKSFDDAFASMASRVAELITEILIIQPLVNSLKTGLSNSVQTGGGGLLGGLILPGVLHGGGGYGDAVAGSPMPWSAFKNAPRLHGGLKSDEFAAVLQKTESVLTQRDEGRIMAALGSASEQLGRGPMAVMKSDIHIHNNAGARVSATERTDESGGRHVDIQIDEAVAGAVSSPGSASAQAIQERFGLGGRVSLY